MKTPKKSRKISVLAAVLILLAGILLGGYLVLKSNRGAASQLDDILGNKTIAPLTCQPNANDPEKDSDGDGLKDWQEYQTYFSDPCETDTDGDGYLDGEEAASGYDPAKKAPGDELPGTTPKTPRPLPNNLTTALSAMLADQIAKGRIESFNQTGQILAADELTKYPALQQSVQSIVANAGQLFSPDPIDEKQIKTIAKTDKSTIQEYARQASACFPNFGTTGDKSEPEIFLESMQTSDFSLLDKNAEIYQTAYKKLNEVAVPKEMLDLHKEQLNVISGLIKIHQAIKQIAADPLKASLALQEYSNILERQANWLQKLAALIESHP